MFKNHDLHLRQQVVEEVTPEAPRKRKPPVAIEPDTSVAPTQVASPSSWFTRVAAHAEWGITEAIGSSS